MELGANGENMGMVSRNASWSGAVQCAQLLHAERLLPVRWPSCAFSYRLLNLMNSSFSFAPDYAYHTHTHNTSRRENGSEMNVTNESCPLVATLPSSDSSRRCLDCTIEAPRLAFIVSGFLEGRCWLFFYSNFIPTSPFLKPRLGRRLVLCTG